MGSTDLAIPELPCRQLATFRQGLEFGPNDSRMADASSQPTIGPGYNVFATDQPGILD